MTSDHYVTRLLHAGGVSLEVAVPRVLSVLDPAAGADREVAALVREQAEKFAAVVGPR
ncbi:MAG: hypothetical protein ACRDYY_16185 [Acidimicrobiales bacterium]